MTESANPRAQHLILLGLVCTAIAAFGAAYNQPLAWILCLPCMLSMFWRIQRVMRWLRIGTQAVAYSFLTLTIFLGFMFMAYPILSQQTAGHLTLTAGYGLGFFAALFLLGRAAWPTASSLFPATIGLLVVDCFNPDAHIKPLLAGSGIAVFLYLSLPSAGNNGHQNRFTLSRWLRLAGFALFASLAATALIVVTPQVQSETEKMRFQFAQSRMPTYAGLSDTTTLGDLEELKLSSRVVLRLWSDRPQDLRARAYTRFDGRAWTANSGIPLPLEVIPETSGSDELRAWLDSMPGTTFSLSRANRTLASHSTIRTRIIQKLFNNGMMVSPGDKLLVRADLPHLRVDFGENLQPPLGAGVETYGVVNRREDEVVQRGEASVAELSEALQLPAATDPRLRDLAGHLSAGADSPEEKIHRTVDYLQRNYHYSLKVGSFHTAQPIAEFLFEKKLGYCQYFASAAAVLLRLEGVPTRYVSGFHVTEDNRSGDHYVVREMDAHAWIESYISSKGWVQADPTPAAEYASVHSGLSQGWLAGITEWVQAKFAEIAVYLDGNDWQAGLRWCWQQITKILRWIASAAGIASVGVVLLLAGLIRRFWKRTKSVAQARNEAAVFEFIEPAPELARMLQRIDACWIHRGVARPKYRTPLEHLEEIPAEKIPLEMRSVSRAVIEAYYRASLGGAGISSEELHTLQIACDSLD